MRNHPIRLVAYVCLAAVAPASLLVASRASFADSESPMIVSDIRPIKPAGKLILDGATGQPANVPLTLNFVRSPDTEGPDGKGRFLVAVNSGYGLLSTSRGKAQQTLSVIDLNSKPDPTVVQTLYFPSPQSANVGLVFNSKLQPDGKYRFYVAGGFENKIWTFSLDPKGARTDAEHGIAVG